MPKIDFFLAVICPKSGIIPVSYGLLVKILAIIIKDLLTPGMGAKQYGTEQDLVFSR
jgi:hypothetical protein